MFGADYAWILHHEAVAGRPWWWQWWRHGTADCTAAQVAAAAENVLIVAGYNRMVDGGDKRPMRSYSGLVCEGKCVYTLTMTTLAIVKVKATQRCRVSAY